MLFKFKTKYVKIWVKVASSVYMHVTGKGKK
jgi:hypothetical protein